MQNRNDRARTKLTQEIDKTLHSTEQTASVRKPGIIWLEKEKKKVTLKEKREEVGGSSCTQDPTLTQFMIHWLFVNIIEV